MTWMLTATGEVVDLRMIALETIRIEDIAHHLAQINRYTGACRRPYSVAEHALLVCEMAETCGMTDPAQRMAALMHDAHEAYTTDLSSPMKATIGRAWYDVEQQAQHQVLRRFGLLAASMAARAIIKWCDLSALSSERTALLPPNGPPWPSIAHTHPPLGWAVRNIRDRAALTWDDWRQAFLDKFDELHFAREQRGLTLVPQGETRAAAATPESPAA